MQSSDPRGYAHRLLCGPLQICFVGDEGFSALSARDPRGPELLEEAIAADGSVAWFKRQAEMEAKWGAQAAT